MESSEYSREHQQFKEHIDSQFSEIKQAITNYPRTGHSARSLAYSQITQGFEQLQCDLKEWQSTSETWDAGLRRSARTYIDQVRADISNLRLAFVAQVSEENRSQLLANAETRTIERDRLADELLGGAGEAKECGIGILDELGKQRSTLMHISGNVKQLDSDLDRGESLLNGMQCRSRQRKLFLVGVCVFLLITIGVFIYYILN
jgi:hypothetical protein